MADSLSDHLNTLTLTDPAPARSPQEPPTQTTQSPSQQTTQDSPQSQQQKQYRPPYPQLNNEDQLKVVQALHEIRLEKLPVGPQTLQEKLQFPPEKWAKYETDIKDLVSGRPHPQQIVIGPQKVIILVGLPGSGKSTLAHKLAATSLFNRVNQDDLKTRKACEAAVNMALKKGQSVVVDRCNFDIRQRHTWIKLSMKFKCFKH
eukprot:TRINITY_DN5109_c0_g1_i1.p1 TRINITY_DN5109_c0_g1~~TRINITY_DN5109_c0_g1_i1.p1  ORF type:complete len:215 (+),score=64.54 TRINITY_DN5109_c0_g1_i1:38-646(+)